MKRDTISRHVLGIPRLGLALGPRELLFTGMLVAFLLLRLDLLPPLLATAASDAAVEAAYQQVVRAEQQLQQAWRTAPLEGARGDYERRGAQLPQLSRDQRLAAAAQLAGDAQQVASLARAGERYRDALFAYDAALMARTRQLGPRSEELRPLTWPVVAQVKPYPPPRGDNYDFHPPSAQLIETWAQAIAAGADQDIQGSFAAARDLGRSTYALKTLLENDQLYRQKLDKYRRELSMVLAAGPAAQLHISHPALWTDQLAVSIVGSTERVAWGPLANLLASALLGLVLALALALLASRPQDLSVGPLALVWAAGAAGLLYLVPGVAAALVGAALLLVAFVRWPATALGLIPAAIPFYYRPRTIEGLSFPLSELLLLIAVAAALTSWGWARLWRRGSQPLALARQRWRRQLLREPLLWAAALLLLAALLSFLSPLLAEPRVALRELRRTVVEPLLFLLLLARAPRGDRRLALGGFLIAAAAVASDALVRGLLGQSVWMMEGMPRLIGLLPSPTALGIILGAALALALVRAAEATGREARVAYALLSMPLGVATLLTLTRGAWIGVAAAVLAWLALRRRWRLLLALGTLLTLALTSLSLLGEARFQFSLSEGTGAARREIWASTLRLLQSSPLFGAGLDQFAYQDAQRFGIPQLRLLELAHPHNLLLDTWVQFGLLGLLALLALLAVGLWRLTSAGRPRPGWLLAAAVLLVELVVHGMFDQTLLGGQLLLLFWACLALGLPGSLPPGQRSEPVLSQRR